MNYIDSHPAHIVIGPQEVLNQKIEHFLQTILCLEKGCTYCKICRQIREKQHPNIVWIAPEKTYTLDVIEPIFDAVSLKRGSTDSYYIIIQHADFLTAACANTLLKVVEEPPAGYHFIFLATYEHQILPTIRSRCIMHNSITEKYGSYTQYPILYNHFTGQAKLEAVSFLKALDESGITERESLFLVDALLYYWQNKFKNSIKQNDTTLYQIRQTIIILQQAIKNPPMPGGSKLFWKNLFLQLDTIKNVSY
ncbi:MAG TPA: hypothetical protein VGW78_05375 [Candidatus Babeliales bacterium]|jgi:hypothetical protein|nr:hypothetical protein [Candidatus Babeliales bacterium]